MVIVKFKKFDEGVFFENSNIERIMKRIFLFSGIDAKFQLSLIGATPLGVESLCEFLEIKTDVDAGTIESAIEHNLPKYWEVDDVFETSIEFLKHELVGQYHISFANADKHGADIEQVMKNNSNALRSFELCSDGVLCLIEENTSKINKVLDEIEKAVGEEIEVVKEELYFVNKDNELVDVDEA